MKLAEQSQKELGYLWKLKLKCCPGSKLFIYGLKETFLYSNKCLK